MTDKIREEAQREELIGSSDASRRQFLKKAIIATGVAVPVIQSFSVRELGVAEAEAGMEMSPGAGKPEKK